MSGGNYDRRAPLAASQIITLERMLEEAESRNEELEQQLTELRDAVNVYLNLEDCMSLEALEALLPEEGT